MNEADLKNAIRGALSTLDQANDALWTKNDMPTVEAVATTIGQPELTRKQITEAAPLFTRVNPQLPVPEGTTPQPQEQSKDAEGDGEAQATQPARGPAEPAEAPKFEHVPLEARAELEEEEVAKLRTVAKEMEDHQGMLRAEIGLLQKEDDLIQAKRDEVVRQIEKLSNITTNQERIMIFIRRQNQNRLERAMRRDKALRGIDLSDIQSKSPLDAAMTRNKKRGARRPERFSSG